MSDDEILAFVDEADAGALPAHSSHCWKVLIVDDDEDVHHSTELSLGRCDILGREVRFLHAYSAADARRVFAEETDLAVILLDVVMETDSAGLQLVDEIRNRYGLRDTRIILRTGQPGYAPELEAIRDYDINDYKNKSELSRGRLYAALTAAIRTYMQIRVIEAGRLGLTKIVHGSAALLHKQGLAELAAGVITQLSALLGLKPEGLVCARLEDDGRPVVIAAAGRFEALIGESIDTLDDPQVRALLTRALEGEAPVVGEDGGLALRFGRGGERPLAAFIEAEMRDGALDGQLIEVFCANVSMCLDNASLIGKLNRFSYCDPLVGLPNRQRLIEVIREQSGGGVLAIIDIDHFGEINGALGSRYGDQLLQAVAARLRQECGEAACVARVGSDMFAVFWPGHAGDGRSVTRMFEHPLLVDENDITISVTVGLVHVEDVEGDGSDALQNGFIALKQAKGAGRGSVVRYGRRMGEEIRDRVILLNELRRAFADDELFLEFQPQVELTSGRCIGAEALLRWRRADGTMVPPDRFIALAEHSGLITSLGHWVIRQACHTAVALQQRGYGDLSIAVNVSAIQFRDPLFLHKLRTAIHDAGVDPRRIELEITESVAMGQPERMSELFDQIRAMQLEIAIDDFGTGFSSLSYLRDMNVSKLKIDRSFVTQLTQGGKGEQIAELVCSLGHRFKLGLVAEGIETEVQADLLRAMGCQFGQGWLFARPMSASAWFDWLAQRRGELA